MKPYLSIIIVSYKCQPQLEVTLDAVFASQTQYSYEVILLDNGSHDGTVEFVRERYLSKPDIAAKLTLIENENVGFPKANNQGMRLAQGEYMLLLNPDTKLAPENLQVMLEFMHSRPDIGMSTCKLVKGNGELDWACRRKEPNLVRSFFRLFGLQALFPKWFGSYNMLTSDINASIEVDACVGAYMLFPRSVFERTGGFDERFFMYGEDLDLCRQVRDLGLKVWYHPATMCWHFKGQSSKKRATKSLYAFYYAMWLYYRKHYAAEYWHLTDPLVLLGVCLLFSYKWFLNLFRKQAIVSQ
jgi:GT2 family glycosyltransferase